MAARILDGAPLAEEIAAQARAQAQALANDGHPPRLVAIRANDDRGSEVYARAQAKWCGRNGLAYLLEDLGPEATEADLAACIARHNATPQTSAVLLHTPLPKKADAARLTAAIDPAKDAEGMHPRNLGRLLTDPDPVPAPCTAAGAVRLALEACPDMRGRDAVVVGHSQIVGRPAALMLLARDATVSVAHVYTKDLARLTREAEVLIVATGAIGSRYRAYRKALAAHKRGGAPRPEPVDLGYLVTPPMVRAGAVVIDVGGNRIPEALDENGEPVCDPKTGKPRMVTVGDVDVEGIRDKAAAITNPKGGAGPMTNAILLRNTVAAAQALAEG